MVYLIRILAFLLIMVAPINIIAQTMKPMSRQTIKRVLSHHKKYEQITIRLRNGEQINGTFNSWTRDTLTIENLKDYNKRVVPISDIAQLKFHSDLKMSITTAKRDLLTIGSSSLNLFMLFTTGKMLTKDNQ